MTDPAPMATADQLELDGVYNLRDLGGFAVSSGDTTATGRLFRADGLHRLPAPERGRIAELGITQVVDLRTDAEIEREGRFESDDVAWHHQPIFQSIEDFALPPDGLDTRELLALHYAHMVDQNGSNLTAALTIVADAVERGPTVFHCTAGKDRTGVVAALILAGMGVDDGAVAADFARSGEGMPRMVDWYRRSTGRAPVDHLAEHGVDASMIEVFLSADPATMVAFLARLRDDHGDVGRFLASIGAADPVDRIGRTMLSPTVRPAFRST